MNLDRNLNKIIYCAFHVLLFATPLVWTSATSELFEFPKMILVYILTIIITTSWLAIMILNKKILIKKTPFDIPILLFLSSQIISTITSINPHTSVFGYYSRFHGGLLSTISYALLYYAFVTNINKTQTKKLLKTILAAAVLASFYAIPEHFGLSPSCLAITGRLTADCWIQDVVTRVFGTFGQPNWLAAYLVTLIPIPLAFIISSPTASKLTRLQKIGYGLLIIFFTTLIFTKSRSGLFASAIGLFSYWTIIFISSFKKPTSNIFKSSIKSLLITTTILFLIFITFGQSLFPSIKKFIPKLNLGSKSQNTIATTASSQKPQIGTQLATGGTESSIIRSIVWKGAIDIWKHYPLFGSGTETFAYSYYNFRPIEHNLVSEWDYLYNKAHNEFLNFAATTGTFGLASYVLIIGWYAFWIIKKILLKKTDVFQLNNNLLVSFLAGFIALAVSNYFGFSTVPVAVLFFIFPAISLTLTQSKLTTQPKTKSFLPYQQIGIFFLSLVSLVFFVGTFRLIYADIVYARGKQLATTNELNLALPLLQTAVQSVSQEPVYKDQLSQVAVKGALELYKQGHATSAAQLGNLAVAVNNEMMDQNSVNLNFYKTRARVFVDLANLNPDLLQNARDTLITAIRLAPTEPKILFNLALIEIQLAEFEKALEYLIKTIKLKPNYEQAHYTIGLLYEDLNQPDNAINHYRYILENLNPGNSTVQNELDRIATQSGVK